MGKLLYWGVLTGAATAYTVICASYGTLFWTIFGAFVVGFDLQFLFKSIEAYNASQENE